MTKEQLKYYIDNFNSFSTELEQKISSIPQEQLEIVDNLNMDSIQDYEKAYEIYSEFCKDIFEKYQMNLEAFTTILSLQKYIEKLYNLCKENNADISICGTIDIKDNIIINKSNRIKKIWNSEQAIKELFDSKYFSCVMWSKIYKKELFKELRFKETTKLAEDLEIIYKIFDKANRIAIDTSNLLYYYEVRENSAVHSKFNENHEKEISIIEDAIWC